MILLSSLYKRIEKGEFSLAFVEENGSVVHTDRCVCTSFHSKGRTMNIKFCVSGVIRTVRRCTIIALNGEEVCL
jgi:hypothetical protein